MIWPFNRKKDSYYRNVLTQEDRETAAKTRSLRSEKRRISEEIELEELRYRLLETRRHYAELRAEHNGGESMEDKIMSSLLNMGMQSAAMNQQQHPQNPEETEEQELKSYSDEEIKQALKQVPKNNLKIAKLMDDNQIIEFLENKFPIDRDTAVRALEIIRGTRK